MSRRKLMVAWVKVVAEEIRDVRHTELASGFDVSEGRGIREETLPLLIAGW